MKAREVNLEHARKYTQLRVLIFHCLRLQASIFPCHHHRNWDCLLRRHSIFHFLLHHHSIFLLPFFQYHRLLLCLAHRLPLVLHYLPLLVVAVLPPLLSCSALRNREPQSNGPTETNSNKIVRRCERPAKDNNLSWVRWRQQRTSSWANGHDGSFKGKNPYAFQGPASRLGLNDPTLFNPWKQRPI